MRSKFLNAYSPHAFPVPVPGFRIRACLTGADMVLEPGWRDYERAISGRAVVVVRGGLAGSDWCAGCFEGKTLLTQRLASYHSHRRCEMDRDAQP